MKRLVSGLLLAALFAGQTALPVAHEWRVASNEAGHHLGTPSGPAWTGPDAPSQGHEHHDEASCCVCPRMSQCGFGTATAAPRAQFLPAPESLLAALTLPPAGPELSEARSPRGPPAA